MVIYPIQTLKNPAALRKGATKKNDNYGVSHCPMPLDRGGVNLYLLCAFYI